MTTVFTSALGVPIDSEGLEEGCNRMPEALRRSGLIATLGVRDLGDVEAGPVRGPRDPLTGGPDWRQTTELLRPLLLSPVLLGADVTILNPSLDPGDHYARRVVDLLAAAGEAPGSK